MTTTKKIFWTESGKGYTIDDVNSLCNYYERTGDLANDFSEKDFKAFVDRFVICVSEKSTHEIDPSGGFGIFSHV